MKASNGARLGKFTVTYTVCAAVYWCTLHGWPWLLAYRSYGSAQEAFAHATLLAIGYAAGVFLLATSREDDWYLPAVLSFALAEGAFLGSIYVVPCCSYAGAAVIGFAIGAAALAAWSFVTAPTGDSEVPIRVARRLIVGLGVLGSVLIVAFSLFP